MYVFSSLPTRSTRRLLPPSVELAGLKQLLETMSCCAIEAKMNVRTARPAARISATLLSRWFATTVPTREKAPYGGGAKSLRIWCRHQESNLNLDQQERKHGESDVPCGRPPGGPCSGSNTQRAPSRGPLCIGAGTRSRTRDLLITNQLLYQLSYAGAILFGWRIIRLSKSPDKDLGRGLTSGRSPLRAAVPSLHRISRRSRWRPCRAASPCRRKTPCAPPCAA